VALQATTPPVEALHVMGLLNERAGLDEEALADYQRASEQDPTFFMSHINRAWILKRLGKRAEFREEMRLALEILRETPRAAPWATGGLGLDAILGLVGEAVASTEEPT
jgi:tetratricopeptide (TPR) repeat protein